MNKCKTCNIQHDGSFGSGIFCSRKCANTRKYSLETRDKISKSLRKSTESFIRYTKKCETCSIEFEIQNSSQHKKNKRFCCRTCARINNNKFRSISGGIKSAASQNRRSKNEIYFAELCYKMFSDIETNVPKFNGWDADIIINDIKTAILWNGKWHYEKITKQHSVEQVQNRDRIKINEIQKFGYKPYIIKDMGKYDKAFVENEFNKFIAGSDSQTPAS
jgi:hypothetical protein